jgi:hypothetical protein
MVAGNVQHTYLWQLLAVFWISFFPHEFSGSKPIGKRFDTQAGCECRISVRELKPQDTQASRIGREIIIAVSDS